ncbi:MAG: DUF3185 domain-containing protein [Kiritimatiellia bacterium]
MLCLYGKSRVQAAKAEAQYEFKKIIAIVLVALGVVVLAYSGITIKTRGKPVDIGPLHVETTQRYFIPPVIGAIALAGGLVLLFVGNRKED